jgi:hypothetical protein
MRYLLAAATIAVCLAGCGGSGSRNPGNSDPPAETRSYYLGFTPFPYAISSDAIDFSYARIQDRADLVAHHLEEGVPWNELDQNLGFADFPASIKDSWNQRKARSPPGHVSYVSLTPISLTRDAIAPLPDSQGGGLPAWLTAFNLSRTRAAYLSYCIEAVEFFQPDYLVIGIEVNELMHNRPELWADYLELQQQTYNALKLLYPGLPVSVSLTGMHLIQGYTDATGTPVKLAQQQQALAEATAASDFYCLSLHTFLSALLADQVADTDLLDEIFSLSARPTAVCETSYPAQLFDLSGLTWNGDTAKQLLFFNNLFQVAENHDAEFIINFVIRDYDDLWIALGSPEDINKMWRDTGFYDESGNPRAVLDAWTEKLLLARQ